MAKVKTHKKSTRIDMTAMCDVAFLLLSFFIMSSTARLPEPYPVDTPSSTVQSKIPDTNLATITVGEDKVFFGVTGKDVRIDMLERMEEKYGKKFNIEFTDEDKQAFALIDFFGVDIRNLKQLIAMRNEDRVKPGVQKGIPMDSTNNQLYDWIMSARLAAKQVDPEHKVDLSIAIKGDASISYPTIKQVIDILQKQRKNNFFLITGLRGDDF